jgi:hypothetical protein
LYSSFCSIGYDWFWNRFSTVLLPIILP